MMLPEVGPWRRAGAFEPSSSPTPVGPRQSPPQHRQDIRHASHSLQEAVQLVRFFLQEPHGLHFYAQDGTHLILQSWKFSYRPNQQCVMG